MGGTDHLDQVVTLLDKAQRLLFITGAGISADSGLPTYRGIGGLYHDRLTDEGWSIEEALSGGMLQRHPAVVWKYIAEIEKNCRGAKPNAAHFFIAALEEKKTKVWTLTQNIDGLHRLAGSSNLIEIHGRVHRLLCTDCGYEQDILTLSGLSLPPVCPSCEQMLRPDVVLFGEMLPRHELGMLETLLADELDLVLSVGTSSIFPYIAGPVHWAAQMGIPTVEINPGHTNVSHMVSCHLKMGAAAAMREIWARLYPGETPI